MPADPSLLPSSSDTEVVSLHKINALSVQLAAALGPVDPALQPAAGDIEGTSLKKINQLVWNMADAGSPGAVVANLARTTFASPPIAQPIPIQSLSISGNAPFELYPPDGIKCLAQSIVQISTWIQLAAPPSQASVAVQLDTTATAGGSLFKLVTAGFTNTWANAWFGWLCHPGDILRVVLTTDSYDTTVNYGYLTLMLVTPVV